MTRYVIDDAHELSRVLLEMDGEGNVKSRYIYGLGLIGREDADGTYLSYHYDLRGSTTLLTDEQNRVTDRYTYGLHGELDQHEGLTQQPFAYNGRDGVMTDVNGLYYMRARYYDPKLKRFLNRDVIRGEIQDGQTFNRYAYVNGNPVSYNDPLGLMKFETKSDTNLALPYGNESKTMNLGSGDNPLQGALNVDIRKVNGVDVVASANHLPFSTCSFSEVIAQNPHGYDILKSDVPRILENGGIPKVVGGEKNPFFKNMVSADAKYFEQFGFELVSREKASGDLMFGVQKTTDGKIFSDKSLERQYEVILRRKY
ncbi:RHS repeat-associated core domain-containing protein [Paenibacillus amylolyticus]|uniref:RHS repeat-associated core domain-containing protein n=1 Tax=Paenibacillus amylolyticus TaxID=1451 RepID=UPI00339A44C5